MKILKYYFHGFMKSLLPYIARLHPQNRELKRRWEYPQLWNIWCDCGFPYRTKRRTILNKICGLLTGHELSKTEWGYGGGGYVDRHCRWCDQLIKVPKKEEIPPDELKDLDEFKLLGFND